MNHADVGVIQSGSRLRFARQQLFFGWFDAELGGQKFQRDGALQPQVGGLVHHAHAARAQLPQNLEVADALAARNRRRRFGHRIAEDSSVIKSRREQNASAY